MSAGRTVIEIEKRMGVLILDAEMVNGQKYTLTFEHVPSDGSVRGRGGIVNVSALALSLPFALAFPFPDPRGLPRRPLVGFSSPASASETTLLDRAPSLSFIFKDGRCCGAGERLAETDVDAGAGDVSLKSLVECTDGDLEVDLEGPGRGWGDSSLLTDGSRTPGGVPSCTRGRTVREADCGVFLPESAASSPGFWVSELASVSAIGTLSLTLSLTLGAPSASSSDMSILDPGLSGAATMMTSCSASDPFWFEWGGDSTSGS